jgi:hypothetical protein
MLGINLENKYSREKPVFYETQLSLEDNRNVLAELNAARQRKLRTTRIEQGPRRVFWLQMTW